MAIKAEKKNETRGQKQGKEKETAEKENRWMEKDLQIHKKKNTERRKNKGRAEEESSFDLSASPSSSSPSNSFASSCTREHVGDSDDR